MASQRVQPFLDQVRDRRLARPGQSGKPQNTGFLVLQGRPRCLIDIDMLHVDVLATAQREVDQPGADRVVAEPVDQDEAASVTVLGVWVERDRTVEVEVAHADRVELERLRGDVLHGVDVHLVLDMGHRSCHGLGADLEQIGATGQQRFVMHPHQRRFKLIGRAGR